MTTRQRIAVAFACALCLIIGGVFAHAQAPKPAAAQTERISPSTVISGSDIGFSVQRRSGDRVQGTLVVRINGEWVPAEPVEKLRY